MDEALRKLERKAKADGLYSHFLCAVRRIGRQALQWTGPDQPTVKPRVRAPERFLRAADPWGCGCKGEGKRIKSRAHRRVSKAYERDWDLLIDD